MAGRASWMRWAGYGVGALAALALAALVWLLAPLWPLPSAASLRAGGRVVPSSFILDRNGKTLYEIIDPDAGAHRPLSVDDFPLALRQAIIATEDATFYSNPGVNLKAIVRALWLNLRSGQIVSGGSTITQQVARNVVFSPEQRYAQTWQRKMREAALAVYLTTILRKDEILALYLNETYFGNLSNGAESAARAYFAKPAAQLDLAECALLAGLPQAPSAYNPLAHPDAAKARQRVVLDLMVKQRFITAEEADLAYAEPLQFASAPFAIEAPHFCMLVRDELAALVGEDAVRRGGLRVVTTLDLDLQRASEGAVRRQLAALAKPSADMRDHNVHNAAALALDPRSGAIRMMVGSPDYFDADNNGAMNAALALRQPGSAIKPLTYAAAFERGYSPATMISDVPTSFLSHEGRPYVPLNYDYAYHGPVLLRQALACSYNVVAVKLLDRIGADALMEMATRLGITTLDLHETYGLALTLGGGEVQLTQLAAAYGALANGGWRVRPYSIEQVQDAQGNILYQAQPSIAGQIAEDRVLDERVAYLVTDILADNQARAPAFGEASPLEVGFAAAAKTGTTTEWRDNWTMGYSTELVVGVWVGNANNEPMRQVTGITGAAPIWNAIMRAAHRSAPAPFRRPPGLVEATICAESGQLPGPACSHRRTELFLPESRPTTVCTLHRLVALDARTGQVALPDCPADQRVVRPVTFWPAEALAWAEEQGLPLPPVGAERAALEQQDAALASAAPNEPQTAPLYLSRPARNSRYQLTPALPAAHQQVEIVAVVAPELQARPVTLRVDGQAWQIWPAPPYRALWPLAVGRHTLQAVGIDSSGRNVESAPLEIEVVGLAPSP